MAIALLLCVAGAAPLHAQSGEEGRCLLLCTPDLAIEPTLTVEGLAQRPRIAVLADGTPTDTVAPERETVFEIVLALGVPTTLPRTELTLEAIWAPFAGGDENPFTGRSAGELGVDEIDDNAVELETELNLILVTFEETDEWLDAHFDIIDKFSPAEDPDATGTYTHKLNLELDAAVLPFRALPEGRWLRNLELETSLDYMATGLPDAGDVVSGGEERYLDDASPWSLSFVLVMPLAPLDP